MKKLLSTFILVSFSFILFYGCKESVTNEQRITTVTSRVATRTECPSGTGIVYQTFYIDQMSNGKPVAGAVPAYESVNCDVLPVDKAQTAFSICAGCHKGIAGEFISSRHVVDNIADATQGFMKDNAECISCHTGGKTFDTSTYTLVSADNRTATSGLICESCHNQNGSFKGNVIHGPSSDIASGSASCIECHADIKSHAPQGHFAPFNRNIKALYGPESVSTSFAVAPSVSPMSVHARVSHQSNNCVCHAPESFTKVVMKNTARTGKKTVGDNYTLQGGAVQEYLGNELTATPSTPPRKNWAVKYNNFTPKSQRGIACADCHSQHAVNGNSLVTDDFYNDNKSAIVYSSEFLLCTSCHVAQVDAIWDKTVGAYTYALSSFYTTDGGDGYANLMGNHTDPTGGNVITDTHFGGKLKGKPTIDPITGKVTWAGAETTVVGYNINAGDRNACTQCHDQHGGTVVRESDKEATKSGKIAVNWGKSAHNRYTEMAFTRQFASPCNKCHNGRAFVYFSEGDTAINLNKHAFGSKTGSIRGQSIGCATCHNLSDNVTGAEILFSSTNLRRSVVVGGQTPVRQMQEIVETAPFQKSQVVMDTIYADWDAGKTVPLTKAEFGEKSLICLTCHAGRTGTGNSIVDSVTDINAPAKSVANQHHFTAVSTIKGYGPYKFDGKVYSILNTTASTHKTTKTYCVSCHDLKSHTLMVFEDADTASAPISVAEIISGNKTNIKITGAKAGCACHTNGEGKLQLGGTATTIVEYMTGYNTTLSELATALQTKLGVGATVQIKLNATTGKSTLTINAPNGYGSKDVLGSAYNLQYFVATDPAGWAHGMDYSRQIIWDSMLAVNGTFTDTAKKWLGNARP